MGTTERRVREKQDVRRVILDAARELFATESYKAVSMRRIAEKIEYSPGAIYLHFKDKDEILDSLAEEGFRLLGDRLAAVRDTDPLDRLREAARVYLDFAMGQPHYYRIMFELTDSYEAPAGAGKKAPATPEQASARRRQEMTERVFQIILAAQREAVAEGALSGQIDEVVATHVLWAQVHGVASLALAGRLGLLPEEDRQTFFDAAVDSILCGISPCCDP